MHALTQKQIQFIISLRQSKFRHKSNKFIIEGDKICKDVLRLNPVKIHFVCATTNWLVDNQILLKGQQTYPITEKVLKKLSSQKTPNQVLMVSDFPDLPTSRSIFNRKLCFYLDRIQDPGNMGTILRIADWFGMSPLYLSPDCVDIYNPKVVQASMGTIMSVSCVVISFDELLGLKDQATQIIGSTMNGKSLLQMDLPSTGLLIIGNESKGISSAILKLCDEEITIPSSPMAKTDSLNAGVACGILAAWGSRNLHDA